MFFFQSLLSLEICKVNAVNFHSIMISTNNLGLGNRVMIFATIKYCSRCCKCSPCACEETVTSFIKIFEFYLVTQCLFVFPNNKDDILLFFLILNN
jgi:hypothetical protein